MSQDQTLDLVSTLIRQEEDAYFKWDYLSVDQHDDRYSSSCKMDSSCRRSMIAWMKTLVDFCHYSGDTLEKTVSCLDRYLATPQGRTVLYQPEQFLLAVLTCLYTTVKIHERQALEPESIAKLSRGVHSKASVEKMELRILQALQWRGNPPTSITFGQLYLDLLPSDWVDCGEKQALIDLVQYQTYLASLDYSLSMQKPSAIALAALLNALESTSLRWTTSMVETNLGSLLSGYHPYDLLQLRQALLQEVVSCESSGDSTLRQALLQTTISTTPTTSVPHSSDSMLSIQSSNSSSGMVRVVSYEDNMTALAMEEDETV
mmetsp:Transcript_83326/g.241117  ORF Transcript_83326/g.241117 Transcript_83326/m.241117 type:complete len:318 (+) Transcript_83326:90-1043(+)